MQSGSLPYERAAPSKHEAPMRPLFEPLDYYMVRTPLFPVQAYRSLSQAAPGDETFSLHPTARLALGIGSRALLEELERPPSSQRAATRRDQKLLRYLIRMATRPTPFGLFAGVALGHWGQATDLLLETPLGQLQARLDMGWLLPLIWKIEAHPAVRRHLHWFANTAFFLRNGRVYLHERATDASQAPQSVSLRATPAVRQALELARQPIVYSRLVEVLCASLPGATLDQVEGLLAALWQQTVLLTELRPPLTGDLHPAHYLQQQLAAIPETAHLSKHLASMIEELCAWETHPEALTLSRYLALLAQIERFTREAAVFSSTVSHSMASWPTVRLPAFAVTEEPSHLGGGDTRPLLQVDLGLALTSRELNNQVAADAARLAEILLRLTPFPHGPAILSAYRTAFLEHYGPDRMVPLVELLDQQVGLGVRETGNLDDAQGKQETANSTSTQMLVQLALAAQQKRQMVVELDEGHLKRLETWRPNAATVPDSVELNVFVVADSADAVDAGRYQLVPGPAVGGQAAGRMFGRFAALFGEEGRTALAATAAHVAERAPQTLLAELVYLPGSGRFCNVAIRPALHRYELVYATSSGVSQENTIPLNELVMGMRGGRLYLRWPQKQVDILPHESHQLSTLGAPTLVRLLSALSMEGCPLLMAFDWREAASFPFLPRVQMGRLVLSLARWRLTALTRERDLPTSSPETFQLALAAWREWWQVPRYVYLSLVDHRLLLDLENPQQRELLRAELQGVQEDSALTLQEVFPPLDQTWVQGPGGQYMTELVVPLTRRSGPRITASLEDAAGRAEAGPSVPARTPPLVISTEQRLKGLGSEWMFVKLYCGKQVQDEVIAGPLRAFARMILQSGFAREWFFLRYADPTPHLRVRFQGDPAVLLSKLLPMLCEWCTSLVTNGPCWKFNFDLYDREIERYGGLEGMELAEGLFGADSRAVADLLALLAPSGPLTLDRKLLAILMMDELLRCLNPDVSARLSWYRQRVKERHLAGQFYRQHSKQLRLLLKAPTPVLEEVPGGTEALSILSAYRQVLVPLGQRLAELEAAGMLAQPRSRLFEGCLHLHCIRLLGLDRGAEEEVVELLLRTLESLLQHAAGDVH